LARLDHALVHRAHRRADLQADVPARGDEALDRGAQRIVGAQLDLTRARQQHQHVDVGMRKQLAAPVAAHRHQRGARRHRAARPQLAQHRVGVARQRARQPRGRRRGGARLHEVLHQRGLAVAIPRAQRGHARGGGFHQG
jgi:hypothetical protein